MCELIIVLVKLSPTGVVSSCSDERTTSQHVIRVAWTDWITSSKSSMKMRWKNRCCANENSQNWHRTTINSILLWRCDTTGSALDHTKNLFWHTINSVLLWHYRKCIIRSYKNFYFDITINSILLWHCDTTGSTLCKRRYFYNPP